MAHRHPPCGHAPSGELAATAANMRAIGKDPKPSPYRDYLQSAAHGDACGQLEDVLTKADNMGYGFEAAQSYRDNVLPRISVLLCGFASAWPTTVGSPNYQEILFGK